MAKLTLYNGDSLVELDKVQNKSVHLAIIDPPYLIGQGGACGAFGAGNKKFHKEISHIINGFDFAILEKLHLKLIKTNLYIFCNKTLLFELIKYYQVNHPSLVLDILTWEKTNPIPTCNGRYLSDLEYILFIKEKGVPIKGSFATKHKNYRSPMNVKDKRKYKHPTPKPVPLINNYIINSSNEGDTVLDCFLGSGSVGQSALELNRNFIGIELSEEYFNTAKARLEPLTKKAG